MAIARYGWTAVTPPTTEPVTTAEVKKHLEIASSDTSHDTFVDSLVTAAREHFEKMTNRQLLTDISVLVLDRFPAGSAPIYVPRAPLASVGSITYTDSAGDSQTLATSVYKVNVHLEPGTIELKYGQSWPTVYNESGSVSITCTTGHGLAAAVPQSYKDAVMRLAAYWFENRDTMNVPMDVDALLRQASLGDAYVCYEA